MADERGHLRGAGGGRSGDGGYGSGGGKQSGQGAVDRRGVLPMSSDGDGVVSGKALITNPTGLHARPAVKLTKLAKSFSAQLRLRVGAEGKWTDAKSVARVLALKAPRGQTLFFEAEGV